MQTAIIIPTYNAADTLDLLLSSIKQQTSQPDYILAIDSSSSDNTLEILKTHNIPCRIIKKADFDHGTTRQYGTLLIDTDLYIFLTQDVYFVNENALKNLIDAFSDETVGCAYGRQLADKNAGILATHMRLFYYPPVNSLKSFEDRKRLGINTCINSDNFAAYRKKALLDVGGFPENVIFAEDMYVAAKMLMSGWKVAYRADAMIYHSHDYTITQEFKRFFDIGVFHAKNPWILKNFKGNTKNGIKYLHSTIMYCINNDAYFTLPRAIIVLFTRYLGFCIGKYYTYKDNEE